MSKLHVEAAAESLSKYGEELCGDRVEIARHGDTLTAVLSDGLGSGVKANILATLSSTIAVSMLTGGACLEDVVDTMGQTLPICKVRKVAYSTFTILQVNADGEAYLAQYDNPDAFYVSNGKVTAPDFVERHVGDKLVKESRFKVSPGDHIFLVSDGVIYAGIGGVLNLGWRWPNVAEYIRRITTQERRAATLARWMVNVCDQFYGGKPGDDTTVVALTIREPRLVTVAVGPPRNPDDDAKMVHRLMGAVGSRVVCGGTTGKIVAKHTNADLEVDLVSMEPGVPPMARMRGVDLVTEGIITLSKTLEKLNKPEEAHGKDGASRLARILLDADKVEFLVGRAVNPAHQNPNLPISTTLKEQVLVGIVRALEESGKETSLTYF